MHLKVGKDANPKRTYFGAGCAGVGSGFRWNLLGGSALLCVFCFLQHIGDHHYIVQPPQVVSIHATLFVAVVSQAYVLSAS